MAPPTIGAGYQVRQLRLVAHEYFNVNTLSFFVKFEPIKLNFYFKCLFIHIIYRKFVKRAF